MPTEKKTSVWANGLIWFGAAVSIAEIYTGSLLAPLGLAKGLAAIVIGHAIGCLLLYLAGLIGAQTGRSAMETVKMSFGQYGSVLFAVLNILQLVGWTAIMIISGAKAVNVIAGPIAGNNGEWLWCAVIAVFIIVWILIGVRNLTRLNMVAMGALFVLTVVLSFMVFGSGQGASAAGSLSFSEAVELSVAMPLSWLPLISDYTRFARKPKAATAASAGVYFLASCWMYIIGLGAALFTGQTDIALIFLQAGLGFAGVLIIIFSTVTTTFMDAYSAGVSAVSIFSRLKEKPTAITVCILGALLAAFTPIERYQDFLYLIGSVFAPMIAILVVDAFWLKRDRFGQKLSLSNLLLWAVGFVIYRLFLQGGVPEGMALFGITLPVMLITMILSYIAAKLVKQK